MIITEKGLDIIVKCKTCGATYYIDMFQHFKLTGHVDFDVKVVSTPWK
jgi:hypothetical protein